MRTIASSVCGAAVLALLGAGCGTSHLSGSGGSGAGGSPPNPDPCNLNSGFAGDNECIPEPPAGTGVRLHFGPSDYSPASVAPFLLQPGGESVQCFYQKTTNPMDAYFNEYHGHMRPGSHHMRLFVISTSKPDGIGPCSFADTLGSRFLFGAQTPSLDVPLPGEQFSPDFANMAIRLPATSQMVMEVHFINTTQQPILIEAWASFIFTNHYDTLGDGIQFIGGFYQINTPPYMSQTVHFTSTVPNDNISPLLLVGHYHAHTTRFSAWWTPVGTTNKQLINESFDWHDPAALRYDSLHTNPAPNATTKTDGGYSGKLTMHKGDTIDWECEIHNDQSAGVPVSMTPLKFANEVYTGEMCNMFGVYAPSFGSTWNAVAP
jgi:hypothetical protein